MCIGTPRPNLHESGQMIQSLLRQTISRLTWLRNRKWELAQFPEMDRDWDFVHIPMLFRLHRAWDPFLFEHPNRAALAASDAPRALYYTTCKNTPSDILPKGYYLLTAFETLPDDKIGRDFHQEKLRAHPDNKHVQRPNGIPLAGQLAKINAFKERSGYGPYVLQTAYLYEVPLDPQRHTVSHRWIVRCTTGDNLVSEISAAEAINIEKQLWLKRTAHHSPLSLPTIKRPASMPTTYDDYLDATRIPELEAHPIEILLHVLVLGFSSIVALRQLRDAVVSHGPVAALRLLEADPKYFGDGILIRDGRHAFRCIPELLEHVQNHGEWLNSVTGHFDLKDGLIPLLDRLIVIGVRPSNFRLSNSIALALRFDHEATNGGLYHLAQYF